MSANAVVSPRSDGTDQVSIVSLEDDDACKIRVSATADRSDVPPCHDGHTEDAKQHGWSCLEVIKENLGWGPLMLGVVVALIWANVDYDSYEDWFSENAYYRIGPEHVLFGHTIGVKFVVNDGFMCFFFGLAAKEVLETLQPGGSLYPPRRAVNPMFSTLGGCIGPVATYIAIICILNGTGALDASFSLASSADSSSALSVSSSSSASSPTSAVGLAALLNGWGVPTATDIALSWVVAVRIFGNSHPAVFYLLVLAVMDDAIGILIIATYYQDPAHPVEPVWLLLVVAGAVVAFAIRKLCPRCLQYWPVYVLLAAPITWCGLAKAHVHPGLALVFVVPFMHGSLDEHKVANEDCVDEEPEPKPLDKVPTLHTLIQTAIHGSARSGKHKHHQHAPLHAFEHQCKHFVDVGLGLFTLANAGVRLGVPGPLTGAIAGSLVLGKTWGIFCFGMLGKLLGFGFPKGVTPQDLIVIGAVAGVGLTVALFVSTEAFPDAGLQQQAKLGALLSLLAYPVALLLRYLFRPPDDEQSALAGKGWVEPMSSPASQTAGKKNFSLRRPNNKQVKEMLKFDEDDFEVAQLQRDIERGVEHGKGAMIDVARSSMANLMKSVHSTHSLAFHAWRAEARRARKQREEEKMLEEVTKSSCAAGFLAGLISANDSGLLRTVFCKWQEEVGKKLRAASHQRVEAKESE